MNNEAYFPSWDAWRFLHAFMEDKAVKEEIAKAELEAESTTRSKKSILEGLTMVKNGGGPVQTWWLFTGGERGLNKAKNSLFHSSCFVILDSKQLYVRVQHSEKKFVEGLAATHNLRSKEVGEPEWEEAACGKRMVPDFMRHHLKRCKSCKREIGSASILNSFAPALAAVKDLLEPVPVGVVGKSNKARPITGSGIVSLTTPANGKRQEAQEWQARNGPVVVVQGLQEEVASELDVLLGYDLYDAKENERLSYTSLAVLNREKADDLLNRADYYTKLAEHYEALLEPTTAVKEAETAMDEAVRHAQAIIDDAKATEDADRKSQRAELDALIRSGPPA